MNTFDLSAFPIDTQQLVNEVIHSSLSPEEKWKQISGKVLNSSIPFEVHNQLYHRIWGDSEITYMSFPNNDDLNHSYLAKWMKSLNIKSVPEFHKWSCENRAEYWQKVIDDLHVHFDTAPESIVDLSKGQCHPKWLPGASYNIVDTVLSADPNKDAIVFADEFGKTSSWTYAELTTKVNQVANGLDTIGIQAGDRIAIDMMMTAESVAIYLGIIKAGAEAVSIADSFAVDEIKVRLDTSDAKLIFTQDYIDRAGKKIAMYEKVRQAGDIRIVSIMHENSSVELQKDDISWLDFLSENKEYTSKKFSADKTINVLFSSGTTGTPKAIPWDQTTALKAATDALVYLNTNEKDVWVWPTNLGWMMGPWLVFASLLNKSTLGLFYGAPNAKEFVGFVAENKVTKLGVIPSIVKTW
ncbi:AMP-binding protein, partial [Francisellaceae bacterium]|nr:AMP-binding protein [Francisellaceae bacterium]